MTFSDWRFLWIPEGAGPRVIVDLVESGLKGREREKSLFFDLADRLAHSTEPAEQKRLKEELARMIFGE